MRKGRITAEGALAGARDGETATAGGIGRLSAPRVDEWREGATTSDHNKTMWPRAAAAAKRGREGRRDGGREGRET